MTSRSKVVLVPLLAMLAAVASSACSSAVAQTEDELAAGFTAKKPYLANLYLPDGGTGVCQQLNIVGNNCHDPNGFPVGCCLYYTGSSPSQLQGPGCWEYAPTLIHVAQVGKGFCCAQYPQGYGPPGWTKFEDSSQPCDFCGGKTPGPNECCTRDRDVIPAYPVTDPSICPQLQQDPAHQPSHTEPPCGNQDLIDQGIKLPQQFGPVSVYFACGNHDICYSTCGSAKSTCDGTFKAEMFALCNAYYQQRAGDLTGNPDPNIEVSWSHCITFGEVYYLGVTVAGASSFDKAQTRVCRCCKGGPDGEVLP